MKPGYQVILLYNLPAKAEDGTCRWHESDEGVLAEMDAVRAALERLGLPYTLQGVCCLADVRAAFACRSGATVFNLVERLDDRIDAFNEVPALCAACGCGCTGNSTPALHLTLDKWLTKHTLKAAGIDVPDGIAMAPGGTALSMPAYPLIVKPVNACGSEGIDERSLVRSPAELDRAVRRLHDCGHAALIEQYVDGREFSVSLFKRPEGLTVLPLAEIDFKLFPVGRPHIVDYAVKWLPGTLGPLVVSPRRVPADVDDPLGQHIRDTAVAAWNACGCTGYCRVDMRIDSRQRLMVLEVNANPDISPRAGFTACLAAGGIAYDWFVKSVVENAAAK